MIFSALICWDSAHPEQPAPLTTPQPQKGSRRKARNIYLESVQETVPKKHSQPLEDRLRTGISRLPFK